MPSPNLYRDQLPPFERFKLTTLLNPCCAVVAGDARDLRNLGKEAPVERNFDARSVPKRRANRYTFEDIPVQERGCSSSRALVPRLRYLAEFYRYYQLCSEIAVAVQRGNACTVTGTIAYALQGGSSAGFVYVAPRRPRSVVQAGGSLVVARALNGVIAFRACAVPLTALRRALRAFGRLSQCQYQFNVV